MASSGKMHPAPCVEGLDLPNGDDVPTAFRMPPIELIAGELRFCPNTSLPWASQDDLERAFVAWGACSWPWVKAVGKVMHQAFRLLATWDFRASSSSRVGAQR